MSMVDVSKITRAVERQLKKDAALIEEGFDVERAEVINTDPGRTPWAGVYRASVTYAPGTLGHHAQSWDASVEIKVVVQAADPTGEGAQAEVDLARYEQLTVAALWADPTLGGTVDMLTALSVDYTFVETEDDENVYFPNAIITVTAEVGAG